eukprot:349785-Chlamydomonas_euryale.AAC.5
MAQSILPRAHASYLAPPAHRTCMLGARRACSAAMTSSVEVCRCSRRSRRCESSAMRTSCCVDAALCFVTRLSTLHATDESGLHTSNAVCEPMYARCVVWEQQACHLIVLYQRWYGTGKAVGSWQLPQMW